MVKESVTAAVYSVIWSACLSIHPSVCPSVHHWKLNKYIQRSHIGYLSDSITNLLLPEGELISSSSSRLQAIPLFEAYWLGTSILGVIRTAMGHHYDFEFMLPLGLEHRLPACKASMLTTTPTAPTHLEDTLFSVCVMCGKKPSVMPDCEQSQVHIFMISHKAKFHGNALSISGMHILHTDSHHTQDIYQKVQTSLSSMEVKLTHRACAT